MTTNDESNLGKRLCEIEHILIESIPESARRAAPTEPVYALILAYFDLTTDEYTPCFLLPRDKVRQELIRTGGVSDASCEMWMPNGPIARDSLCEGTDLRAKCHECYELLTGGDWRGKDELDVLLPFREMLYRVSRVLNDRDWSKLINVTDDFVVIVSDYTGYRVVEDAKASIPKEKRELLESRKLLFYEDPDDPWVITFKREQQFKEGGRLSFEEESRFWMSQLHAVASGDPAFAKRSELIGMTAVDCLKSYGKDTAKLLLDFAVVHGEQIESEHILRDIPEWIVELKYDSLEVEDLLRTLLAKQCELDKARPRPSWLSWSCANALHALFGRYPEPKWDVVAGLVNLQEILRVSPSE